MSDFGWFQVLLCLSFLLFALCLRQCRETLSETKSEVLRAAVERLDFELTRACLEEDWRTASWWRTPDGETLLHYCLTFHRHAEPLFSVLRMCRLLVEKGRVDPGAQDHLLGLTVALEG